MYPILDGLGLTGLGAAEVVKLDSCKQSAEERNSSAPTSNHSCVYCRDLPGNALICVISEDILETVHRFKQRAGFN